jgi:hypothetical protein
VDGRYRFGWRRTETWKVVDRLAFSCACFRVLVELEPQATTITTDTVTIVPHTHPRNLCFTSSHGDQEEAFAPFYYLEFI